MSNWGDYGSFPNKNDFGKHFVPLVRPLVVHEQHLAVISASEQHDRNTSEQQGRNTTLANNISAFSNTGYTVSLTTSVQEKTSCPHNVTATHDTTLQYNYQHERHNVTYTSKKAQHNQWMADKNLKKYPILPPCNCRLKKCYSKISDTDRRQIHETFWNQNYFCRRLWIYTRIKKIPVKRSKKNPISGTRRACSRGYYLDTQNGDVYNVCQKYFLATLGYKNDKIITHTMAAFQEEDDIVDKIKIKSAAKSILTKAKLQKNRQCIKRSKTFRFDGKRQVLLDKRRNAELSECEVIERNLAKYPLLPACQCKRNCPSRLSEERRKSVHLQFWCLSYGRRKQWLFKSIMTLPIKRPKMFPVSGNKRTCSRQYFLTDASGQPINVCQKFFLSTLGYSNDKIIVHTMSTVDSEGALSSEPPVSHRGKHPPKHKLKSNVVQLMKSHILSYYPPDQVVGYLYESKIYGPKISVRKLHRHFLMVHSDIAQLPSYESYRTVMEGMNLRKNSGRKKNTGAGSSRKAGVGDGNIPCEVVAAQPSHQSCSATQRVQAQTQPNIPCVVVAAQPSHQSCSATQRVQSQTQPNIPCVVVAAQPSQQSCSATQRVQAQTQPNLLQAQSSLLQTQPSSVTNS